MDLIFCLLLETGSSLLQETGDRLQLENYVGSERNASVTGYLDTFDDRNAKTFGQVFESSEKYAKVAGLETLFDTKSAKTKGKDLESADRNSIVTGQTSDFNARLAKTSGKTSNENERQSRVWGQIVTSSQRFAKLLGVVPFQDDFRSAKVFGKGLEDSERPSKLIGQELAASEKNAKLKGIQTLNNNINAKVTGQDFAVNERNASVIGAVVDSNERNAKVSGLLADERNARVTGTQETAIFIWTGSEATIPAGWTRVTELDGYFPRVIANGDTILATGGNAAHSHTSTSSHTHTIDNHIHTFTLPAGSGGNQTAGNGVNTGVRREHTHGGNVNGGAMQNATVDNVSVTYSSFSNNPPFYEVIFITNKTNKFQGIPNGVVALNKTSLGLLSLADGNNQTPNLQNRFLRGAASGQGGGTIGGSSQNTHTINHTHSTSHSHAGVSVTVNNGIRTNTAGTLDNNGHTHTVIMESTTVTSETNTSIGTQPETVLPPYTDIIIGQNRTGQVVSQKGLIGLYIGDLTKIPRDFVIYSKLGTLIRGSNATGATGGSETHSHAAQSHSHTLPFHTHIVPQQQHAGDFRNSSGGINATSNDTVHNASVSSSNFAGMSSATTAANSANNMPVFRNVALIEYVGTPDQDEKRAKTKGIETLTNERNAKIIGKLDDQAERSATLIGKLDDQAERSATLTGQATDTNERNAKLVGKELSQIERNARVTGQNTDTNERNAKLYGSQTENNTRRAKVTGIIRYDNLYVYQATVSNGLYINVGNTYTITYLEQNNIYGNSYIGNGNAYSFAYSDRNSNYNSKYSAVGNTHSVIYTYRNSVFGTSITPAGSSYNSKYSARGGSNTTKYTIRNTSENTEYAPQGTSYIDYL